MIKVRLYRYNPEEDSVPWLETLEVEERFRKAMVLDVLEYLKKQDATLVYRRSCREGVCGSDGMNINGKNGLACITPVEEVLDNANTLTLRPLPGMPVIRDLAVDLGLFFRQFEKMALRRFMWIWPDQACARLGYRSGRSWR
ncbi:hypothetical protein HZS81_17935 [Halomonas salicampi]|uniref:succinate dehydrogenase n=1 Tax=Vreelandella salicampi TaxID=1449798 RepID=A0A7Z0RWG7_9GAMM|nr:hypothetical protein [Halomonas salicampi]